MTNTIARSWAVAALAVLATGCGYDSPTPPVTTSPTPSSAPATIRVAASSRSDYTTAVVATVLTGDGRFVAGIPIGFSTANGTVSTSLATTDANGSATTIVTTPTNTTVTITIGALTAFVQVAGTSAPSTGAPTPPTPAPTPPTVSPIAIINAPSTAATGTSITFGVSGPAQGQTWTWNFGDGATASTTAFSTTHTYGTAGTYNVTVSAPGITTGNSTITVSAPGGSSASTLSATVTCTAAPSPSVCNVSSVNYGSTTIASSAVTGVTWDWGDGGTGVGTGTFLAPTHPYANAGTYNIVATVNATTADGPRSVIVSHSILIP